MITFASTLYVSDGLKAKRKRICHQLLREKGLNNLYVIYVNEYTHKPEILHSIFLRQSYYRNHPLKVIGLAENRELAMEYVARLIGETYMQTGDIILEENVNEY